MASEEVKKKWGTIFMGDREASPEQLKAMQEPLLREQRKKEQIDDYMERVRARAAERAREILGAAYAERQKVLDEARGEALERKRRILGDCGKLKAEAEKAAKEAAEALAQAEADREEARALREKAREEGVQAGMEQAKAELQEFRLELGQALGRLLRALEWRQNEIIQNWRDDIVTLVQCAAQAGAGWVLNKEHKEIMRALVFQALDLLESRRAISIRVNPGDEEQVSELFRAARERYPELGQWTVSGDERIEAGGLVAESGSGSVDLQRSNFRELVDGVLSHLSLPEGAGKSSREEMIREIVEREASRITSLTPELDAALFEPAEEPGAAPAEGPVSEAPVSEPPAEEDMYFDAEPQPAGAGLAEGAEELGAEPAGFAETIEAHYEEPPAAEPAAEPVEEPAASPEYVSARDPALAALEEELFPLDEDAGSAGAENNESAGPPESAAEDKELELEPETLAQGGFL